MLLGEASKDNPPHSFTPFDPAEDTERRPTVSRKRLKNSFTPFDPAEDTERRKAHRIRLGHDGVSPPSIRPRILKDIHEHRYAIVLERVSPPSIRPRILKVSVHSQRCIQTQKFHPLRSGRGY